MKGKAKSSTRHIKLAQENTSYTDTNTTLTLDYTKINKITDRPGMRIGKAQQDTELKFSKNYRLNSELREIKGKEQPLKASRASSRSHGLIGGRVT